MANLTEETARGIYRKEYYERYKVYDAEPGMQKILLNAYVLSPSNAAKARKKSTNSEEFSNNFLGLLKDNASTWSRHGKGWTSRFNKLKEI